MDYLHQHVVVVVCIGGSIVALGAGLVAAHLAVARWEPRHRQQRRRRR